MTFSKNLSRFAVVLALVLAGCGVEAEFGNKSEDPKPAGDQAPLVQDAPNFECHRETCDSRSQYCLISKRSDVVFTYDCVALPSGCTGCDCAQDDAPKNFPTSNNCSSWIACEQKNARISVTCEVPRI